MAEIKQTKMCEVKKQKTNHIELCNVRQKVRALRCLSIWCDVFSGRLISYSEMIILGVLASNLRRRSSHLLP